MDPIDRELFLELLGQGHSATLTASGLSMLPTIAPGSRLRVAPPPFHPPLAPGDVLLTLRQGRLLAHRLIAFSDANLYQTKGDSLLRPDPPVERSQILGRVIAVNDCDHGRPLPRFVNRLCARLSRAQWRLSRTLWRTLRPRHG